MTPLGYIIRTLLISPFLALMTLGNVCHAQEDRPDRPAKAESNDPHTKIIQQCIALMEENQWQQTLDLLNPLIEQNKDTGLKKHGAKFATAYYYKGLCLLKLAQNKNKKPFREENQAAKLFQSAIESLNQCYAINPPNDSSNIYRAKSLLLRGNAQQSLGKYQLAIDSYKLFLHERNNALDSYNLSDFNINLAICLWKKHPPQKATPDDIEQAIDLLQESLLYTGRNQPSSRAVLTALSTLTDIAIQKPVQYADLVPATLNRTRNISPRNLILPTDLANDSSDQLLPFLSKLILITAQKKLPLASLNLSTLIPGISQHATELEIPAGLEIPTPENADTQPNEATKTAIAQATAVALRARALSFQESNKTTSAIKLYTILVDQYPDTPHQPENLYHLARLAAQSGDTKMAITRCRQLLKEHSQHTLKNPTFSILLNTLYHTQQYQESIALAEQILEQGKSSDLTSTLKDTASFIHAASHYYLGNYSTAASLLIAHQTDHPESLYQADSAYLNAAVQNQLLRWDKSIPLLREFIAKYNQNDREEDSQEEMSAPSSNYLPFAHYDIAYAQYSQRHLHSAILTLLPFTLDIPFVKQPYNHSQISASADILLGNIHLLLRQRDTAAAHYQKAIQLASEVGNIDARDEAYYLLINLLGKPLWEGLTNHRLKETIPYYLHFLTLENAKKSPYYTQILTSAITALEKANPANPELPTELLSQNLFLHNNTPNTPGIETALKTYLYYLRQDLRKEENPTQEIIRILTEEVKTSNSGYHQALLIAAQIETLEHAQQRNPNADIQSQINQLYNDLISQFRSEDLDNFTLLNIAHHLTKRNDLSQAASYYQAIINRSSNNKKIEARLGLAIQLANSDQAAKKQNAKEQLTSILENPFTPPAPRATAHYHIIQLLYQDENWPEIETNTLAYLKYPRDVKTHNLEMLQLLALAYDRQGSEKLDLAISTYTHIWVKTLYSIQHSAPAIERVCQLLWERNNPADKTANGGKSDRQLAYETAYKYIRKTKDHYAQRRESLPAEAIQTWEKIKTLATKTYPKDPAINTFYGQP